MATSCQTLAAIESVFGSVGCSQISLSRGAIDSTCWNGGQGRCPASSLAGGGEVQLATASPDEYYLSGASTRCAAAVRVRTRRPKCPIPPLSPPTPSALLASQAPRRCSRAPPAIVARCLTHPDTLRRRHWRRLRALYHSPKHLPTGTRSGYPCLRVHPLQREHDRVTILPPPLPPPRIAGLVITPSAPDLPLSVRVVLAQPSPRRRHHMPTRAVCGPSVGRLWHPERTQRLTTAGAPRVCCRRRRRCVRKHPRGRRRRHRGHPRPLRRPPRPLKRGARVLEKSKPGARP